jgi:hypothetical protein
MDADLWRQYQHFQQYLHMARVVNRAQFAPGPGRTEAAYPHQSQSVVVPVFANGAAATATATASAGSASLPSPPSSLIHHCFDCNVMRPSANRGVLPRAESFHQCRTCACTLCLPHAILHWQEVGHETVALVPAITTTDFVVATGPTSRYRVIPVPNNASVMVLSSEAAPSPGAPSSLASPPPAPTFWEKWRGIPGQSAPPYSSVLTWELVVSFLGSFLTLLTLSLLHYFALVPAGLSMLVASFGATSVLVNAAVDAPLAQPRNVFVGHLVSSVVGMGVAQLLPNTPWLGCTLAVPLAIVAQLLCRAVHPPAGASALIPSLLPAVRTTLGWWYDADVGLWVCLFVCRRTPFGLSLHSL